MAELTDIDLAALGKRPAGTGTWAKVLLAILVIAGLGFAAGFYYPLYKAHELLGTEFEALGQRARTTDDKLKKTEAELAALQGQKEELAQVVSSVESKAQSKKDKLDFGYKSLETALEKRIKQKILGLLATDEKIMVQVPIAQLFAPNTVGITPRGAAILCEVAAGAGEGAQLTVAVPTNGSSINSAPLASAYKSVWELSAVQGGLLAQTLLGRCKVPPNRVTSRAFSGPSEPAENPQLDLEVSYP